MAEAGGGDQGQAILQAGRNRLRRPLKGVSKWSRFIHSSSLELNLHSLEGLCGWLILGMSGWHYLWYDPGAWSLDCPGLGMPPGPPGPPGLAIPDTFLGPPGAGGRSPEL